VSRWTDALLSKISAEVKDEMSTVYNVAQAVGRQRCEHLEEREKYMEELESGLRTLQQHTDDLKARLQRLRQQEDGDRDL
jgi:alanyl-tRNA synthetase